MKYLLTVPILVPLVIAYKGLCVPYVRGALGVGAIGYVAWNHISIDPKTEDNIKFGAKLAAIYAFINPQVLYSAFESLNFATFGALKPILTSAFDYIIIPFTDKMGAKKVITEPAVSWSNPMWIAELAVKAIVSKVTSQTQSRLANYKDVTNIKLLRNLYKYDDIDVDEVAGQAEAAKLSKIENIFLGITTINFNNLLIQPIVSNIAFPIVKYFKGEDAAAFLQQKAKDSPMLSMVNVGITTFINFTHQFGILNFLLVKPFEYVGHKAYQNGYVATGGAIYHYLPYVSTAISIGIIAINSITIVTALYTNINITRSFKFWQPTKYEQALDIMNDNVNKLNQRLNYFTNLKIGEIPIGFKDQIALLTKNPVIKAIMQEFAKFNNKNSDEYLYAFAIKLIASGQFKNEKNRIVNIETIMMTILLPNEEFKIYAGNKIGKEIIKNPTNQKLVSNIKLLRSKIESIDADIGGLSFNYDNHVDYEDALSTNSFVNAVINFEEANPKAFKHQREEFKNSFPLDDIKNILAKTDINIKKSQKPVER